MNRNKKLILPALRGRMGDWFYYVTLLPLKEIAVRVSMADEIHQNKGLNTWIQRQISPKRISDIVKYLKCQEQRFFNALILGIYGGKPSWQELDIENKFNIENIGENDIINLSKTFGVLTLNGDEKIFAIDGQHRTNAIKEALKDSEELGKEEITGIFIAHKTDNEGLVRTRRLFSTLNRYAKPVSISEIIALDEEDNCAIITRNLVDNFKLFQGKILFSQNRSMSTANRTAFTNIIILYDIVKTILTDKLILGIKVANIKVDGEDHKMFTSWRASEDVIQEKQKYIENIFYEIMQSILSLKHFFDKGIINRELKSTSLLFRPIGQNILFNTLKIGISASKKDEVLQYFSQDNFNLSNRVWRKVFFDVELERLKTDKFLQKFVVQLILKHIGIDVELSKKEEEVFKNFNIDLSAI